MDRCVAMLGERAAPFVANRGAPESADILDAALRDWIRERPLAKAEHDMAEALVVCSPIYTIEDIINDETYRLRGTS